ncbi:MAG: cation transporter [Clostridia bacterium]|nr:cation transporter [Clostridia bacterium]
MAKNTTVYPAKQKLTMGRRAGIIGILVNILLFGLKLFAGIVSGSMAVIADAVNNITDAASSILVLLGYVFAAKPPDKEHPYGHARMESLCSLGIAILVTVLGIELFTGSLGKLIGEAEGAVLSNMVVVIMLVSVAVKLALAFFYRSVGRAIDSASLRASAADSIGDVCASAAVVLGMFLTPITGPKTDAVLGCGIAVYIFIMGVKLILEGVNTILGAPPDKELVKEIIGSLRSYDGVMGIHDLVIHNYGMDKYFASVHLEMDAERDIMVSHDIIDNIEADFAREKNIHLVIHLDPINQSNEQVNHLRGQVMDVVAEIAGEYSSPVSMHDFRVVFGVSHTNLIFDVAVTNDMPLTDEELVEALREEIRRRLGTGYKTVITVDRDYSSQRFGR